MVPTHDTTQLESFIQLYSRMYNWWLLLSNIVPISIIVKRISKVFLKITGFKFSTATTTTINVRVQIIVQVIIKDNILFQLTKPVLIELMKFTVTQNIQITPLKEIPLGSEILLKIFMLKSVSNSQHSIDDRPISHLGQNPGLT